MGKLLVAPPRIRRRLPRGGNCQPVSTISISSFLRGGNRETISGTQKPCSLVDWQCRVTLDCLVLNSCRPKSAGPHRVRRPDVAGKLRRRLGAESSTGGGPSYLKRSKMKTVPRTARAATLTAPPTSSRPSGRTDGNTQWKRGKPGPPYDPA